MRSSLGRLFWFVGMLKSFYIGVFSLIALANYGQVGVDFTESSLPIKQTIGFRSASLISDQTAIHVGAIIYGKDYVGVRQQYLTGGYVFGKEGRQTLGLLVHVKNRGNLISENVVKLAYKQRVRLNDAWDVALAGTGGFYNILLESTNTTPGASDLKWNTDWSLAMMHEDFNASVFYGNVNNPVLRLIDDGIVYDPYWGVYSDYSFDLINILETQIQMVAYYQFEDVRWRVSVVQELINNIGVGLNGNDEVLGLALSINDLEMFSGLLDVHLGYAFPVFSGTEVVTSPFQVQLTYNKND